MAWICSQLLCLDLSWGQFIFIHRLSCHQLCFTHSTCLNWAWFCPTPVCIVWDHFLIPVQTFSISTAPLGTFMVKLLRTQTLPSLPRVNFFSCYHFLPDTQPPKSLSFCQILCFSYVNSSPCYCILSPGQLPSVPVFPSAKKIFHFGFLVVCLDPPRAAEL